MQIPNLERLILKLLLTCAQGLLVCLEMHNHQIAGFPEQLDPGFHTKDPGK
jgi:hypothetical protein